MSQWITPSRLDPHSTQHQIRKDDESNDIMDENYITIPAPESPSPLSSMYKTLWITFQTCTKILCIKKSLSFYILLWKSTHNNVTRWWLRWLWGLVWLCVTLILQTLETSTAGSCPWICISSPHIVLLRFSLMMALLQESISPFQSLQLWN